MPITSKAGAQSTTAGHTSSSGLPSGTPGVQWDIGTFFHREDQAVVSWHFCAAMEDGTTQSFDGLSLLRWNDREEICFLQEFGCNQHRYDPYAQGDTPVFRDEKPLWF
mgnify:CR=1 FL=1